MSVFEPRKRPLCQLSHNRWPSSRNITFFTLSKQNQRQPEAYNNLSKATADIIS